MGYSRQHWEGGDVTHQPLEDFVDDDDGCFYHPAIVPYMTDGEKELLDAGELGFISEVSDEEMADDIQHVEDAPSPKTPHTPQPVQTINYIINVSGGTNTLSQGPSRGPTKRRKR